MFKKTAVTKKEICQLDSGRNKRIKLQKNSAHTAHVCVVLWTVVIKAFFHKGTEVLLETQLGVFALRTFLWKWGLPVRKESSLVRNKQVKKAENRFWKHTEGQSCAGSAIVMEATAALRGNSVFQTWSFALVCFWFSKFQLDSDEIWIFRICGLSTLSGHVLHVGAVLGISIFRRNLFSCSLIVWRFSFLVVVEMASAEIRTFPWIHVCI